MTDTAKHQAIPALQGFHPLSDASHLSDCTELIGVLRDLLRAREVCHTGSAAGLLHQAARHGVQEWIAWHANAGHLKLEDTQAIDSLRAGLRMANAAKLAGDAELLRLFTQADLASIGLLLIKGEALARWAYPAAACRPTADFDLLVDPACVARMKSVLADLGYHSWRGYHGQHVFAQQFFVRESSTSGRRYQLDLHWDIANRRYFRNRLPWPRIAESATRIPVEAGAVLTPAPGHSVLIACVHLAAADLSDPLQLKWLLDINLLLDRLSPTDLEALLDEARAWGLLGPLAVYARMAEAVLGESPHAPRIAELPQPGEKEREQFLRCCDQRWYDLAEYARRLPGMGARFKLLGEVLRYRLRR